MLLRLEGVHFHRQLRRRDDVRQKQKSPALDLCAIAQVEVFRQRVVIPAAGFLDTRAPPDARRAVEIEEPTRPGPRGLLDEKVTVQQHRLNPGEQ